MLISLKAQIAVFAMPKTGSTALEAALAPHCDLIFQGNPRIKHMPVRRFERFIRPYLVEMGSGDVQTAALMREPEEWLGSWYRYRCRPALKGHRNSAAGLSFDQFVDAYLSATPPPYAQVGRPFRFITRRDDTIGIDHLFRYDAMPSFIEFLSERFGTRLSVETQNVSPGAKSDLQLSSQLRDQLRDHLAQEYDVYETVARRA